MLEVEEVEDGVVSMTWSIGLGGTLRHKPTGLTISEQGLKEHGNAVGMCPSDIQVFEDGRLGQGAGGVVMRAEHVPSGMQFAVKSLKIDDKEKRQQLVNELRGLIDAQGCAGLVQLHGAFTSKRHAQVHVVLELMNLGSLRDLLKRLQKKGLAPDTGVPPQHIAWISTQALLGLQFLHDKSLLHRDIKPENVLHNDMGEVKLTDFGITKELSSSRPFLNTFVGTSTYLAPERAKGESYGFGSDIWSFGMVLFELATQEHPLPKSGGFPLLFEYLCDRPEPRLSAAHPPSLQDFAAGMLVRDIDQRATLAQLRSHAFLSEASPPQAFSDYLKEL